MYTLRQFVNKYNSCLNGLSCMHAKFQNKENSFCNTKKSFIGLIKIACTVLLRKYTHDSRSLLWSGGVVTGFICIIPGHFIVTEALTPVKKHWIIRIHKIYGCLRNSLYDHNRHMAKQNHVHIFDRIWICILLYQYDKDNKVPITTVSIYRTKNQLIWAPKFCITLMLRQNYHQFSYSNSFPCMEFLFGLEFYRNMVGTQQVSGQDLNQWRFSVQYNVHVI